MRDVVRDVLRHWSGRLTPVDVGAKEVLPDDTRQFLTDHGLPAEGPLLVQFTGVLEHFPRRDGESLAIGNDGGVRLVLAKHSGEVLAIDPAGELPDRFVNSDLPRFLQFLGRYEVAQATFAPVTREVATRGARALRDELRGLDPRAIDDPEAWWAVILEQTEQGFL
jgi:hypothetical protein